MSSVGIIHPGIDGRGGAENVCLNTIEALQDSYEITLYTNTIPDLGELNSYFDTDVSSCAVDVVVPNRLGNLLESLSPHRLGMLRRALLNRAIQEYVSSEDIVISTKNEFQLPSGSIQYVHYPFVYRKIIEGDQYSRIKSVYDSVTRRLANVNQEVLSDQHIITNSEWTREVIEDFYGVEATVVYPPVRPINSNVELGERESGFVSVGRVEPHKRTLMAIEIIDKLVNSGFNTHLHLVGAHTNREYSRRVQEASKGKDHIRIEGEVKRSRLEQLLRTHQYGIHTKAAEHFGVVVAEMLSAGMIPFVPNSGGQVEIVGFDPRVLYDSQEEAVQRVSKVLSDVSLRRSVKESLPDVQSRFGPERYRKEIAFIVDSVLTQAD